MKGSSAGPGTRRRLRSSDYFLRMSCGGRLFLAVACFLQPQQIPTDRLLLQKHDAVSHTPPADECRDHHSPKMTVHGLDALDGTRAMDTPRCFSSIGSRHSVRRQEVSRLVRCSLPALKAASPCPAVEEALWAGLGGSSRVLPSMDEIGCFAAAPRRAPRHRRLPSLMEHVDLEPDWMTMARGDSSRCFSAMSRMQIFTQPGNPIIPYKPRRESTS